MHHFRDIDVLLYTGNNVIIISPYLRLGVRCNTLNYGKADTNFLFVFNRNFSSITHRFRHIEVSSISEMTSSLYIRKGSRWYILDDEFRKGDPNFLLVFNNNFSSITHRFRYIEVSGIPEITSSLYLR